MSKAKNLNWFKLFYLLLFLAFWSVLYIPEISPITLWIGKISDWDYTDKQFTITDNFSIIRGVEAKEAKLICSVVCLLHTLSRH